MGLLLLRIAAGVTLTIQAATYLPEWRTLRFESLAALVLSLLAGVTFLAGFLTPITSCLVVLGTIVFAIAPILPGAPSFLNSRLVMIDVIAVASAIGLLGPGAFSIDAYLFGRREIYIPNSPRQPES